MVQTKGNIFVSYAHDGVGKNFLHIIRNATKLTDLDCDEWTDEKLEAGKEWDKEIKKALDKSSAAVLYIDIEFLTRPYIQSKELPMILTKYAGIEQIDNPGSQVLLPVIPVLVESVFLDKTMPWVTKLQMEPENSMRSIIDPDRKKFKNILTLSDLTPREEAIFTAELAKIFYKLPVPSEEDDDGEEKEDPIKTQTIVSPEPDNDWNMDYLTRGYDLISNHIDLHILLSHAESSCYQIEVSYHYRQQQDADFRSWKGYVSLPTEPSQTVPAIGSQHAGAALLDARVSLCGVDSDTITTVRDCFNEAKKQSQKMRVPLQFRIGISANAGELHYIPWETLPCPVGKSVIEQQGLLFSRTALPSGDESVECHTRAQTALRVLRVYSDAGIAAIDGGNPSLHTAIQQSMKDSLSGFEVDTIKCKDLLNPDPLIFLNLLSATAAFDILYLACEGIQRGCEYYLQMNGGELSRLDLVRHFRQSSVPRIVILVPARQLEDGAEKVESTQALMHFAAMFSQLGTAGVISCQQAMASGKWQNFLSKFSENLNTHGHIPGAVTEARSSCLDSEDNWKPVLLTRIKSTRVWYKPGFVSDKSVDSLWEMLLTSMENQSICPVIGTGIDFRLQQSRLELAREMADEYDFPLTLSYRINLPAVAQYARALEPTPQVFEGKLEKKIRRRIATVTGQPDSQGMGNLEQMTFKCITKVLEAEENNPYNILARLPINMYITTNLDPSLEAAFELVKSGHSKRFIYPSKETLPDFKYDVFDFTQVDLSKPDIGRVTNIPLTEFNQHHPLIVQMYGSYKELHKAVIAEDDYLDFLATFGERIGDSKGSLGGTLGSRDLIFLGFKWNSLEFRVLFRALQRYANGTAATRYHIAVQIDPDDDETIHPDKALDYLRQYFSGESHQQAARISLYWGSTEDFLQEFEKKYSKRFKNRN